MVHEQALLRIEANMRAVGRLERTVISQPLQKRWLLRAE
jgi:hypothetical protein